MRRLRLLPVLLGALLLSVGPPPARGDSAAAEKQYRVGRRLAAEGSSQAVAALREVIALDPGGPLADDARVDLARYFGAPDWPERLGRIRQSDLTTARTLLDKALENAGADRAVEARYYRGLLLLEPYPGRSESGARLDLVAVATQRDDGEWAARARYAGAVLDERMGDAEGARAAYQRVVIDDPESLAAARARVGLARLALVAGQPGRAAEWAQQAIDRDVGDDLGAIAVREAALRGLLARGGVPDPTDGLRLLSSAIGVRTPTRLVGMADGGLVIGGRRVGEVLRLDARGSVATRWALRDLAALAASPGGTSLFAAAGDAIVALVPDGTVRPIADLGEFAAPAALVADGTGRFWVLDRKGARLGQVDPQQRRVVPAPATLDGKLTTLVWDGGRLLGIEAKTGDLLALGVDGPAGSRGSVKRLMRTAGGKAIDLAVAPGGYVAVLDGKTGAVTLFDRSGTLLASRGVKELGPIKPVALAFGPDGALHVFDGSNAAWWRSP